MNHITSTQEKKTQDIRYAIGFNDKEGIRTCSSNRFLRMVEKGDIPELCETTVDQSFIHPYIDVDDDDQEISLQDVASRMKDILYMIYGTVVSSPLKFALSGVRSTKCPFIS